MSQVESISDKTGIEDESNQRSLGIATVYNLLVDNNVTQPLTLAADLWAVEQDIVNTIDHPIIGIVENTATLAMGTNPIVKLCKDFPKIAVKLLGLVGSVVGAVVLLKLVF